MHGVELDPAVVGEDYENRDERLQERVESRLVIVIDKLSGVRFRQVVCEKLHSNQLVAVEEYQNQK